MPRRFPALAIAAVLALLLAGCADDDDPPPTEPTSPGADETLPETTAPDDPGRPDEATGSLDDLAAVCAEEGMVTVDQDIQAANTDIDIPDCEIHLEPGVGIDMADLSLTGGALVFRADDTGTNLLDLQRLSMDLDSLTVELDGPDDAFRAQRLSITTTDGIDIQIGSPGDDGDDGEGGTIHMIEVTLTATGPDSIVQLATSRQAGTLRLERSSIDSPADPRLLGAECVAELDDTTVDCAP